MDEAPPEAAPAVPAPEAPAAETPKEATASKELTAVSALRPGTNGHSLLVKVRMFSKHAARVCHEGDVDLLTLVRLHRWWKCVRRSAFRVPTAEARASWRRLWATPQAQSCSQRGTRTVRRFSLRQVHGTSAASADAFVLSRS